MKTRLEISPYLSFLTDDQPCLVPSLSTSRTHQLTTGPGGPGVYLGARSRARKVLYVILALFLATVGGSSS